MRAHILFLCLLLCLNIHSYDELMIQSYIDGIEHYDLDNDGFSIKESNLSSILRNELEIILRGPLGSRLLELRNVLRPSFVQVEDPIDAFLVSDGKIYYMENVGAWYSFKNDSLDIPENSYLDVATLGTLISHEIGHTELGRRALDIDFINSFKEVRNEIGQVTFVFSREKVYTEEYRAVDLFENPYREYIGLPLRESYFEKGDVLRYSAE